MRSIRHVNLRFGRPASRRRDERGAVLALVAIGAWVLLGSVALGVDLGRLFEERRAAQAAVDHAATAAAYAACTGSSIANAQAAGTTAALRNGFNNDGTNNVVTIATIGGNQFEAKITSHVPGTFSRAMGVNVLTVTVEADANCLPGGLGGSTSDSPGAIFAGGNTCAGLGKRQLDVSGSFQTMIGGVHTNGNAYVATAPNFWTDLTAPPDPFTYSGTLDANQAGNIYDPGYPAFVPAEAWPTGYNTTDVAGKLTAYRTLAQASPSDNQYYVSGNIDSAYILSRGSGLYYATGNIEISFSSRTMNVTLVAAGEITISGSNNTLSPFRDDLLALAGLVYSGADRCDKYTVKVSGSNNVWLGLMWAPTGLLEMSGQNNSSVAGWLMAWAIRLNGSNITIENDGAPITTGNPLVLLNH